VIEGNQKKFDWLKWQLKIGNQISGNYQIFWVVTIFFLNCRINGHYQSNDQNFSGSSQLFRAARKFQLPTCGCHIND
jgi:hypothetical protein